jgi:hypothetical protein
MANIEVMQGHGTYVDYIPQKTASSAAPLIVNQAWLGVNQFRFTIQGLPSTVLQIYTSTNLTTWSTGNFVTNISGMVNYTDCAASRPKTILSSGETVKWGRLLGRGNARNGKWADLGLKLREGAPRTSALRSCHRISCRLHAAPDFLHFLRLPLSVSPKPRKLM